jgi:hypothetical protein
MIKNLNKMKIFFNAFWSGFIEKTNPVHVEFFLELFSKVFNTSCEIGDINTSNILIESNDGNSVLKFKKWDYTILFSGESYTKKDYKLYDIFLCGSRNKENIINCPLFIPFIYCNKKLERLEEFDKYQRIELPEKDVLVVMSNPQGVIRNKFLSQLEKKFNITYAGNYKNNIGGSISHDYNSEQFADYVKDYKFIVTMENSIGDTYITEKIIHGLLVNTIPIYWGSSRILDYFNRDRFLIYDENNFEHIVAKMSDVLNKKEKYLEIVNNRIFSTNKLWRNIDDISRDIRKHFIIKSKYFNPISQIYFICEKEFENERFHRLEKMIESLQIDSNQYKFICPTYKHLISKDTYKRWVKKPLNELLNWVKRPLRNSELSLFINFMTCLEDIDKRYLEGFFITFESDILLIDNNLILLSKLWESVDKYKKEWELIHFGYPATHNKSIINPSDEIGLFRTYTTRCTDTLLWNKKGVEMFLQYVKTLDEFCEPFDHFICRFLETDKDFRHLLTTVPFFIQASNYKGEYSTIQNDKN